MRDDNTAKALEHLDKVMDGAACAAAALTIEAVAKKLGLTEIDGVPVLEFYDKRMEELMEKRLAKYADADMATVSVMKQIWDQSRAGGSNGSTGDGPVIIEPPA